MGHEINEFLATHCTDVIDIANGVDWIGLETEGVIGRRTSAIK